METIPVLFITEYTESCTDQVFNKYLLSECQVLDFSSSSCLFLNLLNQCDGSFSLWRSLVIIFSYLSWECGVFATIEQNKETLKHLKQQRVTEASRMQLPQIWSSLLSRFQGNTTCFSVMDEYRFGRGVGFHIESCCIQNTPFLET